MSQPIWQTPAGNLGTVPEGVFYQNLLIATDPGSNTVSYQVIAGDLPQGIEITKTGIVQGVPSANITVGSEQVQVGRDVTSKFAVRAYTTTIVGGKPVVSRISDRTFSLTIASQSYPQWVTPAGELTELIEGTYLSPGIQLVYKNNNTSSLPDVSIISGQLPPGLTVSDKGLISGVVVTNPGTNAIAGYSRDGQGYAQYPYDFPQQSISYNYEFTLQVTDGQTAALRTFSIFVFSTNIFNASTTYLTSDNTEFTASVSSVPSPIILNPQGSIGTARNDNFYAYQFIGEAVNGDQLNYSIVDAPPGLTLDPITGWLSGYIPNLGLTELTYEFTVYAYSTVTAGLISEPYDYSITFIGPISTAITWLTPSDLGTIANGAISKFYVKATSTAGLPLQYQIASGTASQLPQGLRLLPSGNIVGRVSFNTFAIDSGYTTFDNNTTTFDMTFTFTVNAFSLNGYVSVFKTFTIKVVREYNQPYDNLYIECMPPRDDRLLISNLLQNKQIFPPELLYRYDDPNFGLSSGPEYRHAYGLTATTLDNYVQSLELNHYWKNLLLGSIKTAQALDPTTGQVIYEVVYSEIVDNLVNNEGQSVFKQVVLPYPLDAGTSNELDVVYPNPLKAMRDQVIDSVGQVSNVLPEWMLTKQADGTVLGFQPAWVIAYTIPGASGQIAYNISSQFGDKLNLIDFKADRYELDRALTVNWDPETISLVILNAVGNGTTTTINYATQLAAPFAVGDRITVKSVTPSYFNGSFYVTACSTTQVTFNSDVVGAWVSGGTVSSTPHWVPAPPTTVTFDIKAHYTANVDLGGSGYNVGDQILVYGNAIGGTTGVNDLVLEVNTVSNIGTVEFAFYSGQANMFAIGNTYSAVAGTNITGTGSSATWNIEVVPGTQTVFDENSMQFNTPADLYTDTDEFNRYLLYPKRNILD